MVLDAAIEQNGRSTLCLMLSFPSMVSIMYLASPNNFHWHHCFNCILFGVVVWLVIGVCGLFRCMEPWKAVILTLEAGFGLVPMVYLLFDFNRVGDDCFQKVHQSRIFASIPVVIMAKQLGRTVVDTKIGREHSTWWHVYVDFAEMLTYFIFGWSNASDLGEIWFLIYCGSPVTLSSLLLDHLVLRLSTLHRAHARLMQTAFAAVVRVDGFDDGKVLESSVGFDALVDGQAEGSKLQFLFTAAKVHLDQLYSPSADSERVVRRLRTSLVSMSKAFQQDVELRVLSATEDELQNEKGLLLGVSIMGERLPFKAADCIETSSCLLEQYLDDVGQLRVADGASAKIVDTLPELIDVTSFDSVSNAGLKPRHRRRQESVLSGSDSSISKTSISSHVTPLPEAHLSQRKVLPIKEKTRAYADPWKDSLATADYLKECSRSMLEDLVTSWNYSHTNCCHWHEAVSHLSKLVEDMARWHSCGDSWPVNDPIWQCNACSSAMFSEDSDQCWLCYAPKGETFPRHLPRVIES